MGTYRKSEDLRQIAVSVVENNGCFAHLKDRSCKIGFQYSDYEKKSVGRTVYADTQIINEKIKQFCPYDFIITFYEPNTVGLPKEKLEHLMYHELRHVGYDPEKMKYYIVPHEIEDFRDVVDMWGIDWI